MLSKFARTACERMRMEGGGYRRDHFRALAQRVEVDTGEVRIMGSKSNLLQTLAAVAGTGTKLGAVPSFVPKWCTRHDSNVWPLPSEGNALSS
jgi:site-specific DNA recombinase